MIRGLAETAGRLAQHKIPFFLLQGEPEKLSRLSWTIGGFGQW